MRQAIKEFVPKSAVDLSYTLKYARLRIRRNTHLDEILALHDLPLDPPAGDLEHFRERSLKNLQNRIPHHHVFDVPLIEQMLDHVGLEIVDMTTTKTGFLALATKN